jgi:hypothetical protein
MILSCCRFINIISHKIIMFKVANTMTSLLNKSKYCFSKDIFLSGSNPIRERVMSTPTWPVPYYQRLTKAYPIRGRTLLIQKKASPVSVESTCQLTILLGSPLNTFSTKPPREDRLSPTPSKTSKLIVIQPLVSLSHQEGRLRDHGEGLRQRHFSVFGCHKQGKCKNPERPHFDLKYVIQGKSI